MDLYQPQSEFLRQMFHDEIHLGADKFGAHNLQILIALTRDEDRSNRDWATFFLGQHEGLDSPDVGAALLRAAKDEDFDVRCEAILGLARRNASEAYDLVKAALEQESVGSVVVEAAGFVARRELVPLLEELLPWEEAEWEIQRAMEACKSGVPTEI